MDQVQVDRNTFTRLVAGAAKAGSMLIYNSDATNTVNLTDIDAGNPATASSVPLGPTQAVVVDGNTDVYAFATVGTPVVYLIPGATSFFQRPSLAAIGGASVFVQATVPGGSIPLNSLWFDTANASLQTWNGTMWVNQQFDANQLIQAATILGTQIANNAITAGKVANGTLTSAQLAAAAGILGTQIANATITSGNIAANTIVAANIAANTITAAQLAAGIVYAGIIDGTTVKAASFIGGNYYGYDGGVAAAGKLSVSVVPGTANVTDSAGNIALPGHTVYQTPLATGSIAFNMQQGILTWYQWGGASWAFGASMDWTVPNNFVEFLLAPIRSISGTRANPTLITTDSRTNFGVFGTGFGAGTPAPWQALCPTGAGGVQDVVIGGQILTTAATAANSTMVSLIKAPAVQQDWIVPNNVSGYTAPARVVRVDTSGNVRLLAAANAANQFVILDGIRVTNG